MEHDTPSWGITPVPERLRVLGLFDLTLLWGNLSVSLLVIVAAAGLVPMLSLPQALLAIVIGGVAGNVLLGLAGAIGADARVPGMVLLRAPLGRRGSYAPTVLNVAQNLGWSTFELIIISTAAAALSERVFGFRERWLWALLFGAISLVLGLMGPIGFVRRYLKKFAAWAVAASIVYLTWWVLDKADLHALWHQNGTGGVSIGQGIDLVIANIVSWTPLAADYTRFARDRRSAFFGAGVGYLLPTVWCFGIGSLLVLSSDLSEPTQIPTVVATGSALAVVALLMLTVDESDEAFADIYSTAVSLQNLLPTSLAAAADRARRGDRHRRRDRDRPRQLPDLPLPARLGLRAALRRAARRLAGARRALLRARRLREGRACAGRCSARGRPASPSISGSRRRAPVGGSISSGI